MSTDSEELPVRGIETATACWQTFSAELGWTAENIQRFFCHHSSVRQMRLIRDLKLSRPQTLAQWDTT